MKRLALAIVFVLGFAPPAWADFQAGVAAYNRGDYATAFREMEPLAEQGFAGAQFNLGVLYLTGRGVPQDHTEAVRWFRRAAEQDYAGAQFNLGFMYLTGRGVPQDYVKALNWYKKAAEQDDASAQENLGLMYAQGQGVPQDYAEAAKWFQKAAEQGVSSAQFNLALYYYSGKGVPQDYAEVLKWYRKAARQGHPGAQVNLGVMYGTGEGIPQDYVQAHKWYNLAASRLPPGDDRDLAGKNRDIVAAKMTAAQIAEAQRLAREWKPKTQKARAIPKSFATPPTATSETVESIQTSLATLGYKPGPADGVLGTRTRSAIEAFQRDQGMSVTGKATTQLRDLLWVEKILNPAGQKPKKVELSD